MLQRSSSLIKHSRGFSSLMRNSLRPLTAHHKLASQINFSKEISTLSFQPHLSAQQVSKSTTTLSMKNLFQNRTPFQYRFFSSDKLQKVVVPSMGDSISDGEIQTWHKNTGDFVQADDMVVSIETDKIVVDIRAPHAGKITETKAEVGDTVAVGDHLFSIDQSAEAPAGASKETEKKEAAPPPPPKVEQKQEPAAKPEPSPQPSAQREASTPKTQPSPPPSPTGVSSTRSEHRVKMTRLRERVSSRLKESQNTYAMLTTFNEVDMSALVEMRNTYKDAFFEKHGVKLGFMSCFVKAAAQALREQPTINAVIDGKEIVYRDYVDISVAVATPTGLVVPVLQDCDKMSFSDIEKKIADLGKRAREGSISLEEMAGGTFTISNGGVYGSMMGTPIINPPQSAILGMHGITKRAVVVNDQIVIRPMMYLALTYDHRLIDGKEAVTFLRHIRDIVADPRRLILDL